MSSPRRVFDSTPWLRGALLAGALLGAESHPARGLVIASEIADGAYVESVRVVGNLAYLVGTPNDEFSIVDISDPTHPSVVGALPATGGTDLEVSGRHAYVVDPEAGLRVVDVSDPTAPHVVGGVPSPPSHQGGLGSLALVGDLAYAVGSPDWGLRILDVSDPSAPTELGHVSTGQTGAGSLVVRDGLAYFLGNPTDLLIYDVRDASAPVPVGSWTGSSFGFIDLELDGARAYLSDGGGNVRVVDVSDPHQPMDLGSISGTSATRMLTFANGVAYLSRSLGIELWDLSDLSHPRSLGSIRLPGVVQDIAVVDHWAFAANEDAGFRVVDLSNPVWPRVAGQFDLDPMAQISPYGRGFELAGGLAYVADGQELRLIDLSASGGLREISRVDSYSLDDVALVGSYAYASGFEFQVADFSDPVLPHAMPPVGFQCDAAFCGELVQIEVVGSTGYILTLSGFLLTVDVSDPSDPRLIRAYKTERTTATSMRLLGGKAYIAEYNPSLAQPLSPILEVLDVSDPADPVLVGSAPLLVPVAGLDVHDPLAYVTEPSLFINGGGLPIGDLAVYDIGDLQAAKRLGSVPFPAAGRGLEVVDGIAYAPPWAIDVSDPSRPRVLGGAGPPAFAVEVASGRVYETSDAFRVLDFGPEYAAAPEPDARSAYGIALWGLCMLRWRAAIGCRAVRGKSARH